MCDLTINIVVGVSTGIFSSWLTSTILKKHWDKQQGKKDFENEKQEFCRFLSRIRTELALEYKYQDYKFVIRAIEDEPFRDSFERLSEEDRKRADDIMQYINKLRDIFGCRKTSLSKSEYEMASEKILQYIDDVLDFTEKG